MSDNSNRMSEDQEIDMSQVSKNIGNFFDGISTRIFRGFLFFRRNILVIGLLIFLGVGMGFYLDKTSKMYVNEIRVASNFGSPEYLYSKIALIQSKIVERDTTFLKEVVGVSHPKQLSKVSVKSVVDVYKFINDNDKNFEMIKLLAENGDIRKIVKEDVTSKNYPFHTITVETRNKVDFKTTIQPILNYLNNSEYYEAVQKVAFENIKRKIADNDLIISQIDGLLNSLAISGSQNSNKLVYYNNENTQLGDVIKTKDEINKEQGDLRLELVSSDKIIKEVSSTLNVRNVKGTKNKLKLILPLFFMFLFILGGMIKSFYRRQMVKLNK